MNQYITYHKIIDKLNAYQISSPRLNSFGWGNLVDFGKNVNETTVVYPYLFIVPQSIEYNENTTLYQLSCIFADRLNDDIDNDVDAVSDMSLAARELLSTIKRGFLQDYMEVILPQQAQPFVERFNDNVAGVALDLNIIVYEDINACPQYTECGDPITQYLEVQLQDNTKFKLALWDDAVFTDQSNALCDYVISGTAFGSSGTTFNGEEIITTGQHQHQFNLAPILQPGEIVIGFTVDNYYTIGCTCPINLILPE